MECHPCADAFQSQQSRKLSDLTCSVSASRTQTAMEISFAGRVLVCQQLLSQVSVSLKEIQVFANQPTSAISRGLSTRLDRLQMRSANPIPTSTRPGPSPMQTVLAPSQILACVCMAALILLTYALGAGGPKIPKENSASQTFVDASLKMIDLSTAFVYHQT
jgi:hypothetical protein